MAAKTTKTAKSTPFQMPTFKPTECEITVKQQNAWDMTRTAFLWQCPAFAHVFYQMMVQGKRLAVFTKDIPIAATDGRCIMINPDTFFNYKVDERVFAIAHEVAHGIFNHIGLMYEAAKTGTIGYPDGSVLPYDHKTMNVAADLVINDMLIQSNIGSFNKDWLHDTSLATYKDSVLDAYAKVYKKHPPSQGGDPNGQSFDEHLAPGSGQGQDPQDAANQRNNQQWKATVAAAVDAARAQGKLPLALDRLLGNILEPQVDWREHIMSWLARKLGSGSYDWHRPNRRLISRKDEPIYAPGRSGFGCGTVVVGLDTSGSIDYGTNSRGGQSTGDMFLAEVAGILELCKPKRVIMMWCDAAVGRVDECDEVSDLNTIRAKGAPGGGGTDFRPVFDEIEKLDIEPDALVYLTDGLGTFPAQAPDYPVIWGNITPDLKYPFGEVVNVPKQV